MSENTKPTEQPPFVGASGSASGGPCQATPRKELLRQLLDSRIPKNEREWCAAREIEEMLDFIREQVSIWDGDGDSGFPLYEDGKRILARHQRSPNSGISDGQSQYPVANTPTKAEESQ